MRRHRLKGNFGAKIRVIHDAIWRNLRAFLVSVFGFRQKMLLISVALEIKGKRESSEAKSNLKWALLSQNKP
jgi:hypothetical protein